MTAQSGEALRLFGERLSSDTEPFTFLSLFGSLGVYPAQKPMKGNMSLFELVHIFSP